MFFFAFAERFAPSPCLLLLFARSFLSPVSCLCAERSPPPPGGCVFHAFPPSTLSVLGVFFCGSTCYLIPVNVPLFFRSVFLLHFVFVSSMLSCVLFAGETPLSCAPRVGAME